MKSANPTHGQASGMDQGVRHAREEVPRTSPPPISPNASDLRRQVGAAGGPLLQVHCVFVPYCAGCERGIVALSLDTINRR